MHRASRARVHCALRSSGQHNRASRVRGLRALLVPQVFRARFDDTSRNSGIHEHLLFHACVGYSQRCVRDSRSRYKSCSFRLSDRSCNLHCGRRPERNILRDQNSLASTLLYCGIVGNCWQFADAAHRPAYCDRTHSAIVLLGQAAHA